jgi:hypothetical protein
LEAFAAIPTGAAARRGFGDGRTVDARFAAMITGALFVTSARFSRTEVAVDDLLAVVFLRAIDSGACHLVRVRTAARAAIDTLPTVIGLETAETTTR